MTSSLSNLVNDLAKGIHKIKCNTMKKKCKTSRIKYKDCNCFLKYTNFQEKLIEYKCL